MGGPTPVRESNPTVCPAVGGAPFLPALLRNIVGDVAGDVAGDAAGDVAGDAAGDVAGTSVHITLAAPIMNRAMVYFMV